MRLLPCRQAGCAANVEGYGYCPKHKSDNDRTRDLVRQRYNNRSWNAKCGMAPAVKARNPMCQKLHVVNGRLERCHNPSYLVHHRWSPRARPELFLSVYDEKRISNLIALCATCHPADAGTPDWVEARDGDPVPPGGGNGNFFVRTEFEIHL
jgi:hypothetical protein